MNDMLKEMKYFEINPAKFIDRDTEEGEQAWEELTNHHAIPFVKEGRYPLTQFWCAYSDDPYENFKSCKEDYADEWDGEGMLAKVVADYILKEQPDFNDWDKVLLYVTW